MAAKRTATRFDAMKKIKLLTLVSSALVSLSQPAWAGPHGGGGGFGGGRVGGFTYVGSDQYGNSSTVSAVQSQLAKLGYYRGAVDGVEGDETEAALARYQEDHDLSVTGTLTAATLQSLGLAPTAS